MSRGISSAARAAKGLRALLFCAVAAMAASAHAASAPGERGGREEIEPAERVQLASGEGKASLLVQGEVSLRLRAGSGSVEVVAGKDGQITLSIADRPNVHVALVSPGGGRYEAEFDGRRQLRQGALRVEVPRGSRVDLSSLDGSIAVRGVAGEARVRAMSGDVDVVGASVVDVEAVDGEVDVLEARGPVTVKTISGNVTLTTTTAAPRLDIETASGNIDWKGDCQRGCRADLDSVSGELRLALGKQSSFELSFMSHSGKLKDAAFPLARGEKRAKKPAGAGAGWVAAAFGAAEGEIESETFSGDLVVKPR